MMEYGPRSLSASRTILGKLVIQIRRGMTNAAVLPLPIIREKDSLTMVQYNGQFMEPVSAIPMMSLFCRPMGIA